MHRIDIEIIDMVSSSKKKRGQQRKAAKSQAEAKNLGIIYCPSGCTYIDKSQQSKCNTMVKCGDDKVTDALTILSNTPLEVHQVGGSILVVDNVSLCDILPSVLDFLKRCEGETFDQVTDSIGGDLKSPLSWIKVLARADMDCSLQIAENIGPLVSCMCNDTDRLFFKSNTYWREGIMAFVELIYNMLRSNIGKHENEEKNEIVDALLQHEGLLTAIIQWGYWDAEHRPDIVDELVNNECETIAGLGRHATICLVADAVQTKGDSNTLSDKFKNRLRAIGMTPIVGKAYDPNCMISYTAGMLQGKIRTEDWIAFAFTILQFLVSEADCVDKDIISEVIDMGLKCTDDDYDSASNVAIISYSMILEDSRMDKGFPSDTRTAFAVRSGLIEMCLNFIVRYESQISLSDGCASIFCKTISSILTAVHSLSLHQKTAKAIQRKKATIEEKLIILEQNTNMVLLGKKLLYAVRSILALNGSYCCRCIKSLSRTEVLQCNGCGCMAYCSRACQKEDWLNGHSITCNKPPTNEQIGLFQGRVWLETEPECARIVAKLKELETNLTMIQLKLFLDNSETILSQAAKLDLPLCECLVVFDLQVCPRIVYVKSYTEYFSASSGFECSRSRENITCVYYSFLYNGESGEVNGGATKLVTHRLFPHAWLPNKTTESALVEVSAVAGKAWN